MPWYTKEQTIPLDTKPLNGLFYIDGDIFPKASKLNELPQSIIRSEQTNGKKYPVLQMPSGLIFGLEESGLEGQDISLQLFDILAIPILGTRNEVYAHASTIANETGYVVKKKSVNSLEIMGYNEQEYYLLIFDNPRRRLLDIQRVESEQRSPVTQIQSSPEATANEALSPDVISETPPRDRTPPTPKLDGSSIALNASVNTSPRLSEPPPFIEEEKTDDLIRRSIMLRLVKLPGIKEAPVHSGVGLMTHAALTVLDALDYGLTRQEIQIALQIGEYLEGERTGFSTQQRSPF